MGQQEHPTRLRLRKKLGLVALAAATCLGGTVMTIAPAEAANSSQTAAQNDGLAPIAALALADLQTAMRTGDTAASDQYAELRTAIANEIANRLQVDPAARRADSMAARPQAERGCGCAMARAIGCTTFGTTCSLTSASSSLRCLR